MSAREALIFDVNGGLSVSEAAERHGVVRSCAYKWVARYRESGEAGLVELSRRPEYSPEQTPQSIVDELLKLKRKHPSYGPAKLVPILDERHGEHVLAVSTAGTILVLTGDIEDTNRGHRGHLLHSESGRVGNALEGPDECQRGFDFRCERRHECVRGG